MMSDDDQYDDSQDSSDQDDSGDQGQDPTQAMANAAPEEVDAHRGLIGEALGFLQGQGIDPQALASQAGVGTTDPSQMSHNDLISMAQTLAQQHPEVLQTISNQFPQAQGLLNSVLGGGQGGGGMLGGLLGKLFG